MVGARICILFGIGLLSQAPVARAGRVSEAASFTGFASLYDSSRVFTIDEQSHGRPRWVRRADRSCGLRGLPSNPEPRGRPTPVNASFGGTGGVNEPVIDQKLCGADGDVLDIARSGNTLYIAG